MDENAKELCRREERQFKLKDSLHSLWQELALNFYPERADFTTERALGSEFAIDLFDSEPLRCRRDLGNARASMLRPGGQEWFRAALADDELNERPDIARVLDAINKRARGLIYHEDSGFVRAEKEADHDIVTFGNAVKTVESDIDRKGNRILIIRCWHPRDCAWLDDVNGVRQDVIFRRFKASARHIRQLFPDAELHPEITRALEKDGDQDQEFKLCHVMMPADEYDSYKKLTGPKAPWVSIYYDSQHKMLLRERPSMRFRYIVDRWQTIAGSQYGYSPAAMTALPDGRGIQTMAMVLLEAGEKALDPPMIAVHGSVKSDINQMAGATTWVDKSHDQQKGGDAIRPLLPPNLRPDIGIDLINRTTYALRDTWYLTKLVMPQHTAKTATETVELVQEFIRANIPLFEPWQAGEAQMLSEIYAELDAMRAFGSMQGWPEEMSGANLEFFFKNVLQDAIGRTKVTQFQTLLGLAAGVKEIEPNALHRIEWAEGFADAAGPGGLGSPAKWIADEEQAAAAQQANTQVGNIVGAINVAGQAADVANSGLEAAQKLRELNQPAVDTSAVYGPS